MENDRNDRSFSAEGRVVEILERAGERFAKIVIEPGTVIEAPAAIDLNLGDRVMVDSALRIHEIGGAPPEGDASPRLVGPPQNDAARENQSRPAWDDYAHVLRMTLVFALAIASFVMWRSWMVPADFGVYGHYRAGAIAEIAARTPVYAGQLECVTCHSEVQQERLAGRHGRIACEACHGPLGQHARGETDAAPIRPSTRGVCLTCHTSRVGMPVAFPKVVVKEHSDAGPCTDCHKAHTPGVS
jgi:hypothetical protein